jgi:shikimate kinase / 3-dehydroquinate synthase
VGSVDRIVLIGFSGTGKTSVGQRLAERLGWSAADSDVEIERYWGAKIPTIFRDQGESAFRRSERSILKQLLTRERIVIATGGGAAVDPDVWDRDLLGGEGTLVLALDARPETVLERLERQATDEGADAERPLLASIDPLPRVRSLKSERQSAYDRAHLTISSDGVSVDGLAEEIVDISRLCGGEPLSLRLDADSGPSDIRVGPDAVSGIGEWVRTHWPKARRLWVVTDANVGPLHANTVAQRLVESGFTVSTHAVAPGEGSKSLATAGELYDWLLGSGVERGDVIVALGGGVVGDLAGFVAATVLRGIGLVQVPTTLLAAVDSSVGGKTGINHAAGKNLIGAFLQPRLVIVDTALLATMPAREFRSGWAEVVKHAVIQRSTPGGERGDLAEVLTRNVKRLVSLEEPTTSYVVSRNIALKSAVVAADERETGVRALLNFGHTLGHAIEAADYQLLHGEAVALGMRAASELGVLCGTCGRPEADRIGCLIDRFDLPSKAGLQEGRVMDRLGSDKKRVAGCQRYVLPIDGGGVIIRDDVTEDAVRKALASVNSTRSSA